MQTGSVHVHLNLVHDINVGLAGQFAGTHLVQREIIVRLCLLIILIGLLFFRKDVNRHSRQDDQKNQCDLYQGV